MNTVSVIKHLRMSAEKAKEFAGGIMAELAQTVAEALEEIQSIKADKSKFVSGIIPPINWKIDTLVEGYPNYYDLAAAGVTANDRVTVTLIPGSVSGAKRIGVCPTNEARDGVIRIRAANVPDTKTVLQFVYSIEKDCGTPYGPVNISGVDTTELESVRTIAVEANSAAAEAQKAVDEALKNRFVPMIHIIVTASAIVSIDNGDGNNIYPKTGPMTQKEATIEVPSYGTWTVKAINAGGGNTLASTTVVVDAVKTYEASLNW